jgi:hypothetical protein
MVHLGQGRRGRNWAATDHTTSARFCSEPVSLRLTASWSLMYKAHRLPQSQCTPSIREGGSRRVHVSHGCFTPHLALRSFAGRLSLDGDRWCREEVFTFKI